MTDPEAAAQDPRTTWAPPDPLVSGPGTVPAMAPPTDPPRPPRPPRHRRRWVLAALTVVVLAGLAAGLVVWAPWIPPPVLRPAGLKAGPATANSLTFRWSRPRTGPLPDKYLIWRNGLLAGSAAGTATSYRQAGLDQGVTYQYRLVAVRGGKRSPASALLTLTTLTPPISQARLQGLWNINARNVHAHNIHTGYDGFHGSLTWTFRPVCRTGACAVILHGKIDGLHTITMKLTRAGAVYQGQTVDVTIPCGTAGNSIPDPMTLRVRLRVAAAAAQTGVWAAIAWTGTIAGATQQVSATTFYCPAGNFTAVLDSPD